MRLGKKQELFSRLLMLHLEWLFANGYKVRMGDLFRSPKAFGPMGVKKNYGHPSSCHKLKLAGDLNLFKDGKFLRTSEGHAASGKHWKSLHKLCRWGGDFRRPDGNHYSLAHQGHC